MAERSRGKDSTTGHWEMAGVVTERAFPTYPDGFPPDVVEEFLRVTGFDGVLGNCVASGTAIIEQFGDEHVRTGRPIVYTSADPVFQIAAHEEVIPLARQYEVCRLTRERVAVGDDAVGRVIARPFVGSNGKYQRTTNRRDFALIPPRPTILNLVQNAGIQTVTVGKVDDLFAGSGVTKALHTKSNDEGVDRIVEQMETQDRMFLWANLVDFDQLYGHRQDAAGFAKALEAFDADLDRITGAMRPGDLLMITADHGNDPTDTSTDHSREYVPILAKLAGKDAGVDLGIRSSFADVGATVLEHLKVPLAGLTGTSFCGSLRS
jgi:phosphopentomutase